MEVNITSAIKGAKIVSKQFNDKESGQPINYKQLILTVVLNGNQTEVPITINADKALILQAASTPDEFNS